MTNPATVTVKLGGAIVKFAPPDSADKSAPQSAATAGRHVYSLSLKNETSIQTVLEQFGIPAEQPLMVIVNDAMVARPEYTNTMLADGDAVSLMPPITAG